MVGQTGRPLDGQWALVTGGSKGIGLAIARRFVRGGAHVVVVARDPGPLDDALSLLRAEAAPTQQVSGRTADTARRNDVDELFSSLATDLPALNILVANVGYGFLRPFLELTDDDWLGVIDTNLTGTFRCVQAAARLMVRRPAEQRSILVVSSIRAVGVKTGTLPYSTSKAGLNQLVRVAAAELAPEGIRVNAISPGLVATPMSRQTNPEVERIAAGLAALDRAGLPDDVAEGALYLSSPAASFVTGTNLVVDGGESLR